MTCAFARSMSLLHSSLTRRLAVALGTTVLAVSTVLVAPVGASGAHPTLTAIENSIASTLSTTTVPDLSASAPTLSGAPHTTEGKVPAACDTTKANSVFPIDPWVHCAFGDTHAHRTIYLFGDNAAAQWIPAFRAIGSALKWRVVITTKKGCSPWSYGTAADGPGCRAFVDHEVALADTHHPGVIIPLGEKVLWRGTKPASVRYLNREIQRALDALSSSHSKVVLMAPVPEFNHGYTSWTPQLCLRADRNDLPECESVLYNEATTSTSSESLGEIALIDKLPLIPTRDLFCAGTKCALYVTTPTRTWIVYKDATTINLIYANWVSSALGAMIKPFL